MFCKLFFFYSYESAFNQLMKELKKINESYRIVTKRDELFISLKNEITITYKIH